MSWIDRLAELYELLVGLGIAAAVLAVIAWFISAAGSANPPGDGADCQPVSREPTQETDPNGDREQLAPPHVAALYVAPSAGGRMERVDHVEAVAGRGLAGDRYFLEKGHWSGTDDCEVTIIAQEDIDEIERRFGVRVQNGEHRRNLVIRNMPIENLTGRRFHIGLASFGYERPRPPCAYIQMISEPGMTKALGRRAGICVRCIKGGLIQQGDQIVISNVTLPQALKYRARVMLRRWRTGEQRHG